MTSFADYCDAFPNIAMRREEGIIEVRFHTRGGPMVWTAKAHEQIPEALRAIGEDPGNRVMVFTGTGGSFIDRTTHTASLARPVGEGVVDHGWTHHERIGFEGRRMLHNLLDIEIPIIGVVNGEAKIHAELLLMSDIVISVPHAVFQDKPHFLDNRVPGDGVHVIWPMLMGPNRARYFLLTGQKIFADEAQDLGLVAEIVEEDRIMDRAWELARYLNRRDRLVLRYSRQLMTYRFKKNLMEELGMGIALTGIAVGSDAAERLEEFKEDVEDQRARDRAAGRKVRKKKYHEGLGR